MSVKLRDPMPVALIRSVVEGRSARTELMEVYWRRTSLMPLERTWVWSLMAKVSDLPMY
jgi:hypothetical protein